jgi:predicted DNA-binding transcriptional regulator AlpA
MSTKVATILATYPNEFLGVPDVATILGVSNWAVYKRAERFSIPYSYVGGRLVFLRSALRQWAATKPELDRAL